MKTLILILMLFIAFPLFADDATTNASAIDFFLIGLVAIVIVLVVIVLLRRSRRPEDSDKYLTLVSKNEDTSKEYNHLKGTFEQQEKENRELSTQLELKVGKISEISSQLAKYESTQEQERRQLDEKIKELDNARTALENERKRVIDQESKSRQEEEENRNRIWALHEDNAKTVMRETCHKSDIALVSFDNTSLPDGFDPKLKPDFMVKLLGQFVIFDPKSSQSQNLHTYIRSQVQATAKKIRKSDSFKDLYKTVFFVVPSIALQEIRETSFIEQGICFFVIPLEAFEPIIRTLKRLEDYDLADKYDPQERENIVNVLATYDQHIRQQNATNILLTIRGLQVMSEKRTIPEDLAAAVESRRQKLRFEQIDQVQLKKFIEHPERQAEEILELVRPKNPEVPKTDLTDAATVIEKLDGSGLNDIGKVEKKNSTS
ncbi:MAG: hypothetical protein ACUZ8O_00685 [Candidatus Anammoxibacter sp.]